MTMPAANSIKAAVLAGLLIGVVYIAMYGRLAVNLTDSVPHRLYWRQFGVPPELHGYASFFRQVPGRDGVHDITKAVVCAEGDMVGTEGLDYYCNGRHIATAKLKTLGGLSLRRFHFNGRIPAGHFFALGHSYRKEGGQLVDDSYDSRYFGFVRFDEAWKAVPLL